MRLCLDTSAYSQFKKGEPEAVKIIDEATEVCVPVTVLGELRAGFRCGSRYDKNEEELVKFLEHSAVRILDLCEPASRHYANIYEQLRRNGTPVPTNDMWIAAAALHDGATILTFDPHFELIRGVGVMLLKSY